MVQTASDLGYLPYYAANHKFKLLQVMCLHTIKNHIYTHLFVLGLIPQKRPDPQPKTKKEKKKAVDVP